MYRSTHIAGRTGQASPGRDEHMRSTTVTVTAEELRGFLSKLRRTGMFVVSSSPAGYGYAVTYVSDPR